MSFNAICENKMLAKFPEITVFLSQEMCKIGSLVHIYILVLAFTFFESNVSLVKRNVLPNYCLLGIFYFD